MESSEAAQGWTRERVSSVIKAAILNGMADLEHMIYEKLSGHPTSKAQGALQITCPSPSRQSFCARKFYADLKQILHHPPVEPLSLFR